MSEHPADAQRSSTQRSSTPVQRLRITFWGVQGSIPIFPTPAMMREYASRVSAYTLERALREAAAHPGEALRLEELQRRIGLPDLPLYGGETTCIEVETSEGSKLIFDTGTGIRRCAARMSAQWHRRGGRQVHIFASHEHLDHRSGLAFSRFCYEDQPDAYTVHVHGSHQFLAAVDQRYGVFSHQVSETTYMDDPIDFRRMAARFVGHEIRPAGNAEGKARHWEVQPISQPVKIGRTTVTPFEVYHVIPCCLGYKVEHEGASFVFITDHEWRRGEETADGRKRRSDEAEARVREHCRGVDVAYMDGQYLLEEYLGKRGLGSLPAMPRIDWGHGCVEDAVDRALACNIQRTYIGHHDPERSWVARLDLDRQLARQCEGRPNLVRLADSDVVIDL